MGSAPDSLCPGNSGEYRRSRIGLRLSGHKIPGNRNPRGCENDLDRSRMRDGARHSPGRQAQDSINLRGGRGVGRIGLGSTLEPAHDQRNRENETRTDLMEPAAIRQPPDEVGSVSLAEYLQLVVAMVVSALQSR